MKTPLLLPNQFKKIGWILFIPCFFLTVMGLLADLTDSLALFDFFDAKHIFSRWTSHSSSNQDEIFDVSNVDWAGEILMTLTAIGFSLIAFSRERVEDEWIAKVRLESLLWAFYLHLAFFLLGVWATYGFGFFIWLSWNMLVAPVFFLVRFHWLVYLKPYAEERRSVV